MERMVCHLSFSCVGSLSRPSSSLDNSVEGRPLLLLPNLITSCSIGRHNFINNLAGNNSKFAASEVLSKSPSDEMDQGDNSIGGAAAHANL